jgi:hypothetical protein
VFALDAEDACATRSSDTVNAQLGRGLARHIPTLLTERLEAVLAL